MESWVNREPSSKKCETEEESPFIARGLFGIIRNIHRKTSHFKPTTVFSGDQTVKTFEVSHSEFELQKSKAIAHFKLQTRLI